MIVVDVLLSQLEGEQPIDAVLAVVRSFCAEIAEYHVARQDGEITDAEAREIAGRVGGR